MKTNRPDRDTLYRLYVEEYNSIPYLSKMFECSNSTLHRWLVAMDINRRSSGDTRLGKNVNRLTREELYKLYVVDGLNAYQIRDITGISTTSIGKWLKKYDIITRSMSEAHLGGKSRPCVDDLIQMYVIDELTTGSIGDKYDVSAKTVWRWLVDVGIKPRSIEESKSVGKWKPSRDELYKMYIVDNMSTIEIGEKTGFKSSAICIWLRGHDIKVRSVSESLAGKWVGDKSSSWRGGHSKYCHKFNEVFKESIREEFGRKCFICGESEKDNGRKLDVHHTNYAKMCMCNGMDCRFVPLCRICHIRTNYNRFYWYSSIMCKLLLESSAQFINMQLQI